MMGWFSAKSRLPDSYETLEDQLLSSFLPVEPDPQFVVQLRKRLLTPAEVTLEKRRGILAFIIISFGLAGGIFLYWLFRFLREEPA